MNNSRTPDPAVSIGVHVTDDLLAALDRAYPLGWLPDTTLRDRDLWVEIGKRRFIAFLRHCKEQADAAASPNNPLL